MPVRVRRKALLAYVLFLSSGCLVLWAILFISSQQSVSTYASIELTAEDKFNFPFLDEKARKANQAFSSKIIDSGDVKLMSELDVIQNKTILRALSWEELSAVYHSYVTKNQLECENVERVGRVTDGGWDVCADSAYLSKSDCIVYSFGVDNDFSFDDAAISKFGCMK
ncbi:uncharacterized protein LOC131929847 [Physella acuta]|uniref:uncharacterized protein LOC131929847 n=1 Tax=Physella acuta TaxID=109671 RepID=UPI0027DB2321|nr:uncharacterized protein LOC131929847 [Physella acuta]